MERFVADRMLGKLAKWLRVLGYDTVYLSRGSEEEILGGLQEGRILLTRDRRARSWDEHGRVVVVRSNDPADQLRELSRGLHLSPVNANLFSRCLRCNRVLTEVGRDEARAAVPEYVWHSHRRFYCCPGCEKIFWAGSHSARMRRRLRKLFPKLE
jgi:uncharacterized protein with PIN domain